MLDPRNELLPPPLSPTNSSVSSSDLDTESTGSFFHDRSTTLGTLMGVSFPAITFRAPSQNHRRELQNAAGSGGGGGGSRKAKKGKKKSVAVAGVTERRRRRWWRLCRDDGTKPASSLGEFLEVERRFGDGAFYNAAAEMEGVMAAAGEQSGGGQRLFADGRVLPPANVDDGDSSTTTAVGGGGGLCRFPVSLTAICSGGLA